jgi:hypothetical protein
VQEESKMARQEAQRVEIKSEVDAAKSFSPRLKEFYLLTTAENDIKLQEFVRAINDKHRTKGLFEVVLLA